MGAPVTSGTLAGSTSGFWDSIHKEAASSDISRFGRHPPVERLAQNVPTVAESDVVVGHDFRNRENQQKEIGLTGAARFVRWEVLRREPAVVCQQPPVVRSTQFGDRQSSRPRGRPDYRNRG